MRWDGSAISVDAATNRRVPPLDVHPGPDRSVLQFGGPAFQPIPLLASLPPSAQVLIVQFGGPAFQTVPLPVDLWLACIGVGASTWLVRAALAATPGSNGKEASRAVAPSA